ncbi:DUF4062 domain-containing protein [Candidatus Thiosymbion oneisti]|uniref:DUF4062 domain-containing protein n=1 Tax=Candidatus Thiosymbion oneisti TaxID=589554 RepID=UPI000A7F6C39|nr:DUF4062 domain-containing protein [Candidatus Thiosymbion oneisti]
MKHIRYQVFISSTFRDLQEERQAVLDAVLNMNHFPAGMELFPASDSTPWEVIERVIDDSDYYVLIIGGMYGSTDSDGISYTEREYDYAKKTNKPVLAFLHQDPDTIPAGKVEMKPVARKKLQEFRDKLQNHHCKYWKNAQELQYKVAISLIQEINLNPAIGWVRANEASNEDLLKRIVALTQENDRLRELARAQAGQFNIPQPKTRRPGPVKLFYSYAHADEAMAQRLQMHLSLLRRQNVIDSWSDRRIDTGADYAGIIADELERADIILFLISANFLASDYCWDVEMRRALERHKSGEARVIPVILRSCDWQPAPFGKIQALPKDARPISNWTDEDSAFADVAVGIRAAAEQLTMP